MKNGKLRENIGCFLYVVAFFSFLAGITAESRGSFLDFSNLARVIFCGIAAVCVIAAAIIWQAKDVRGKKELGLTKEDMVIANPAQVTMPPELVIVCGGEQITALKGTYSWEYKNEDGTCTGIEADSMHPLESKEYMSELPLAYSYISAIDAFRAYLQFGIAPDDVEIRYWSTDCWNESTAESEDLTIQAETVLEDGKNITSHSAKLLEGNYIYEVIAKWNGSEEYSGTVHYSFYTVMGNYEPIPVQE